MTVEISQAAQELGVDALIVLLPYFSRPPLPAVFDHFRQRVVLIDQAL